jgi:hypothetical protein
MTDNDNTSDDSNASYVHDPEEFRERERSESDGPRTTKAYLDGPGSGDSPEEQEFGRRGWVLVGMLFVAFAVVPATILYLPQARPFIASLGLTWQDAYLTLPLVPALVLGAMAVWVAVSNQTE